MAPDPRPRRRGHRRGVEPAGLQRWRLSHKRKADPRPRRRRRRSYDPTKHKPVYTGSRGGRYWQGPTKRRYDPPTRRRFGSVRKYGSKVEGSLTRYGAIIGAGLAALFGVNKAYQSYAGAYGEDALNKYFGRIVGSDGGPPEIAHLWQVGDPRVTGHSFTPIDYLSFKFIGRNWQGTYDPNSAWVYPFWGSLIAWIAGKLMKSKGSGMIARIGKVIEPMGKGGFIMSTIGALALPGCPDAQGNEYGAGTNADKTPRGSMLPSPPQNPQYASAY